MEKRKSIKKNYIYNLLYQILALFIPLITTPYISRVLGALGIGAYSYTTAVASYFILAANFGSNYYGSREIAYFRDDEYERSKIFWEVFVFRVITTIASLSVYFVFTRNSQYKDIFIIQSISIVAVLFDISWFFNGIEEFGVLVLRNAFIKLISVVYIFTVVKGPSDVAYYILGIVGATLLGNLSFWFHIRHYVSIISLKKLNPFRNIKVIIQLFIPYIATQIYTALDKTMLGYFCATTVENGYYEQAEKIVKILLTVITTMGTVMVPRFAYLYKNQKWDEINEYLKKGCSFVWCISIPMCLGVIIVSNSFIPWFFGDGYSAVSPLMKVFSLLILAIGLSNLLGTQYLIPTGRQNYYTYTVIFGAAVNIVLNCILVPQYYSMGAAIASVAAELAIVILQIIILRKEVTLKIIFAPIKNYLLAGGIMFGLIFPFNNRVSQNILGTIILILLGMISYGGILLFLKDDFVLKYIELIKNKIHKEI